MAKHLTCKHLVMVARLQLSRLFVAKASFINQKGWLLRCHVAHWTTRTVMWMDLTGRCNLHECVMHSATKRSLRAAADELCFCAGKWKCDSAWIDCPFEQWCWSLCWRFALFGTKTECGMTFQPFVWLFVCKVECWKSSMKQMHWMLKWCLRCHYLSVHKLNLGTWSLTVAPTHGKDFNALWSVETCQIQKLCKCNLLVLFASVTFYMQLFDFKTFTFQKCEVPSLLNFCSTFTFCHLKCFGIKVATLHKPVCIWQNACIH